MNKWNVLAVIRFLTIFVMCVIGLLYVKKICNECEELSNQNIEDRRNLASLQLQGETTESAKGCFVYGSGFYSSSEKQEAYYYFYEEQPEGGYKLVKMDMDEVLICPELEDGEQPYEIITRDGCGNVKYRQMYLPKNAIQTTYDANISNVEAKNVDKEYEIKGKQHGKIYL